MLYPTFTYTWSVICGQDQEEQGFVKLRTSSPKLNMCLKIRQLNTTISAIKAMTRHGS